jgi:hypothetical protein
MSNNDKQHDNDSPNGSDREPERHGDDNGKHVEAPACPAGARCHLINEQLRQQKLTIQRAKVQATADYRAALQRRELACEITDTKVKKLKMLLEGKDAMCKAKLERCRQQLTTRHNKEIEGLKLNLLKLKQSQLLLQANNTQARRTQAHDIKRLQSEVSTAKQVQNKFETAKVAAEKKLQLSIEDAAAMRPDLASKAKTIKELQSSLASMKRLVDDQTEKKLKASVERERLKVQKEEVALKRDEAKKRKCVDMQHSNYKMKVKLQSHKFKCLEKANNTKEQAKKKAHVEKMDIASSRLLQSQSLHGTQNAMGAFPNLGGGPTSIEAAMQWYSNSRQPQQAPLLQPQQAGWSNSGPTRL